MVHTKTFICDLMWNGICDWSVCQEVKMTAEDYTKISHL
jgi:hypothetical protein